MDAMHDVKNFSLNTVSDKQVLNFLFNYAHTNGCALAAWSLPEDDNLQVIVSRQAITAPADAPIEEMSPGFLFAPFDRSRGALFFPADHFFRLRDGKIEKSANPVEQDSLEWLEENWSAAENTAKQHAPFPDKKVSSLERDHYLKLVEDGLTEIEAGAFEKVVPSRCKSVELNPDFSIPDAFLKLRKDYPEAFISLTTSPQSGTWMGASPEELVRVLDKTIFKTVALAGTQPYREGQNLRDVSWTQKEIEEQALVERYIISCFKKIRLREYEEHGPKTAVAGNLMHLRSEFTVNMKETNFPQLGSVMLQLLHPTSAVCGMPLTPALEFLKSREGYDREFYSGYLGPVNIDNAINLFVNLRCMQLIRNKAVVYAGAGVTIDSVPEKEWEETEMKMNTLLSVIDNKGK